MIALLQTHLLVVVLFLLLYAIKVVLLLLNKPKALGKVRKHTKVLDIIFGILILATGGWMALQWNGPLPTYLIIKIAAVLIAIPLGIVGLKRNNKALALLGLLLFAYVYAIAETDSPAMQTQQETITKPLMPEAPETDATEARKLVNNKLETTQEDIVASMGENALTNAKSIYVQVCANCHGEDGREQLAGAPDLSVSSLNQNDRKNIIDNGRGMMPAFGNQLTDQEVETLAAYTTTLNTN